MPRPHAKHHDGLYPTYPKLPNIFRGQVNVWKQPRDLGWIQDLILSWKQAASNINLIQYKFCTLEKNKLLCTCGVQETRFLNKVYKEAKTKNVTNNTSWRMPQVPQLCQGAQALKWAAPWPPQILPLDNTMPPNPPQIQFFTPFELPGVWVEEQEGSISSSNEEINRCMIQDLKHTTGHGIKE